MTKLIFFSVLFLLLAFSGCTDACGSCNNPRRDLYRSCQEVEGDVTPWSCNAKRVEDGSGTCIWEMSGTWKCGTCNARSGLRSCCANCFFVSEDGDIDCDNQKCGANDRDLYKDCTEESDGSFTCYQKMEQDGDTCAWNTAETWTCGSCSWKGYGQDEHCCKDCTSGTTTSPNSNPIEVPAELVPTDADPDITVPACQNVDLSSIEPLANPGYEDESLDDETLSGDDIWQTSFYMMLFANCERQARGLTPFSMYSEEKMLQMQPLYIFKEGHDAFDELADIAGGLVAEAAGGCPLIGHEMENDDDIEEEDDNGNEVWDPAESGRRGTSGGAALGGDDTGLVDHGDSMFDETYTCIFSTVTIGPTADNYMNAILFYGNIC